MTGPIKPEEVEKKKAADLPEEVFAVFNVLIALHWTGTQAKIGQEEIIDALVKAGFTRPEIFKRHLLDVESAYRAVGWEVEYDKPGYNETYEASFQFLMKCQ